MLVEKERKKMPSIKVILAGYSLTVTILSLLILNTVIVSKVQSQQRPFIPLPYLRARTSLMYPKNK
jgi:hypothetical protein